ncbi:hypothetical protein HID58_080878 [Brassica napus]|uniref:Disease resistance protein n=1 Tax=Brassica napus TaxID=3708 RepID=A0ABQ7Y7S9_BRANA|nr:hypothetical protein HID58_080878 [Brassica napus]
MWNVVSSVLSFCFQPAKKWFLEKATYILELEDNLEALQTVAPRLEAVKVDLQNQLEMAERKGLRGLHEFKVWISEVEAIQPKVDKLLEDRSAEIERLSMYGYCSSNFFLTYCYGKDVFEILEKVQSILSSKSSGEVARIGPPPGVEERATQRTVGLEKMLEATWSRLMEKDVGILGLYGMGGIGKTTILKQINKKLLEKKEDEFGVVIFVVVSQNLQVGKIQNEISERLGLCDMAWEKKTQKEKASRIYDVLRRTRFVMLLDDIWRKVDIEDEIGIPLPSPENGSKVVFTTRSKYVCGRMGPHDVEVKQLDPENAWELFRQKVRGTTLDNDPKILQLARKVCEKCKGLPLALNVIGETMACKTTVREWQWAIDVLNTNAAKYSEVEDEILKVLKLSYDDLKDETVQECFQYCALFPEDNKIEKDVLVEYWISEGIINGGGDKERATNQGYRIIGILVNACLLMPVDTFEIVTMHDVLRQMALWVASNFGKEEEKFIVKTGAGLHQMPQVRDWKAVRRMSLANNEIKNISISPVCPNLTTLLLAYNNLVNISGEFFLSMPNLVILDLCSNKNLTKLPEEVSSLVSLRYLDLSRTRLENLPVGFGKLIQLRYLDLSDVQTLQSISVDIKLLENLKGLGGIVAKDGPLQLETAMASLRSIVIQGSIISDIMEHTRYGCRSISAICFQNLTFVAFVRVSGIQDLSWLIFAVNLTFVLVHGPSPELQEIVSREKVSCKLNKGSSIEPFRKLHTIHLSCLTELKSIYWERLELPSLKRVIIKHCPKLKKLPFNKERAYYFDLHVEKPEWFERLEWEDEATEE